jgi:hypothetical protein
MVEYGLVEKLCTKGTLAAMVEYGLVEKPSTTSTLADIRVWVS